MSFWAPFFWIVFSDWSLDFLDSFSLSRPRNRFQNLFLDLENGFLFLGLTYPVRMRFEIWLSDGFWFSGDIFRHKKTAQSAV